MRGSQHHWRSLLDALLSARWKKRGGRPDNGGCEGAGHPLGDAFVQMEPPRKELSGSDLGGRWLAGYRVTSVAGVAFVGSPAVVQATLYKMVSAKKWGGAVPLK